MEGAWLNKHLVKKLDGFYCKCLRRILGISHSYISRISNAFILKQFNSKPLSQILLYRQLILFGRVARMSDSSTMRQLVFAEQSVGRLSGELKSVIVRWIILTLKQLLLLFSYPSDAKLTEGGVPTALISSGNCVSIGLKMLPSISRIVFVFPCLLAGGVFYPLVSKPWSGKRFSNWRGMIYRKPRTILLSLQSRI